MGKKMSKAGAELRRAIRADVDANPGIDHKLLRSKHVTSEAMVESALTKTVTEWDAIIATTPDDAPHVAALTAGVPPALDTTEPAMKTSFTMPGLEQGVVKFSRKPAKMGTDYIFWVPRVYVKNGLVDPACEYEVYLRKKA